MRLKRTPKLLIKGFNDQQESQKQMRDKPFNLKFSRLQISTKELSLRAQNISQESKASENDSNSKRWATEVQQTNDQYQSDFQLYEDSSLHYEEVPEQLEDQVDAQIINIDQQCSIKQHNKEKSFRQIEQYLFYDQKNLNKMNQKLIDQIQSLKHILRMYNNNKNILKQQSFQLLKLSKLKNKVFDITYELKLDKDQHKKKILSLSTEKSIKQAQGDINKRKFKLIKEIQKKAYPSDLQFQLLDLSGRKVQTQSMIRVLALRSELLNKRRLYDRQKQQLKFLQSKQQKYGQIIDMYNGQICKGNFQNLEKRKIFLQNEVNHKKGIHQINEITIQLQINNLQNEIAEIQLNLIKKNSQNNDILRDLFLIKQTKQQNLGQKVLLNPQQKLKSYKNSKIKLNFNSATPKISTKIMKSQKQEYFISKGRECTPKKIVKKFNYDSLHCRNSQFHRAEDNFSSQI